MKYIHLPQVSAGFEKWTITPKWILSGSRLHAICWIAPGEPEKDRFFVHKSRGTNAMVKRFVASDSDDDDQRAIVTCGMEDAIGMVAVPEDSDIPLCGYCATQLRSMLIGDKISLWSSQLAQLRIDALRQEFKQAGDNVADWAMSQFDPNDPILCNKMAKEITFRSPNSGTQFISGVVGSGLGIPSVDMDATQNVIKWIHEAFEDMQMGLKSGAAKRAKILELRKSTRIF